MRVGLHRLAATVVAGALGSATHSAAAADTGVWASAAYTQDLGGAEKLGPALFFDLHTRRTGPSMLDIFRVAGGYQLKDGISVWGGYGFIPVLKDDAPDTFEHRIWEQLLVTRDLGGGQGQLRLRQEQRFDSVAGGPSHRTRALLRYAWGPADSPWLGVLADEFFYQWTDSGWVGYKGPDQNRLFVGIGLKGKAPGTRVEMGLLDLTTWRNDSVSFTHNASMNFVMSR